MNIPRRDYIPLLGRAVSVVLCVSAAAQERYYGPCFASIASDGRKAAPVRSVKNRREESGPVRGGAFSCAVPSRH
jgi:hypothetical protein